MQPRKAGDGSRSETLKDALRGFLKASGLGWMMKHREVAVAWNDAVGAEIAGETRVRAFRDGTLYVDVASPVLQAELSQFYEPSLVQALQAGAPKLGVRRIRFRLGDISEPRVEVGTPAAGEEERPGQDREDPGKTEIDP
ncbi:MAG: DUF721 domain-containing protein [Planctomycetota bacterium]